MPYHMAGIDVHKRMLHVVVTDVEVDGEYEFTRRIFDSYPEALRTLAAWLVEHQVEEVVIAYASHCTSFALPDVTSSVARRSDSLCPWDLCGGLFLGASYRHSFLSL